MLEGMASTTDVRRVHTQLDLRIEHSARLKVAEELGVSRAPYARVLRKSMLAGVTRPDI